MATIIQTEDLLPQHLSEWSRQRSHWLYCGLDAAVTLEVYEALAPRMDQRDQMIYKFERSIQVIAIALSQRGMLVDNLERLKLAYELLKEYEDLAKYLNGLADAVWDQPLNHRSPTQLAAFFYEGMGLPVQHAIVKRERKPTTNREALEKLSDRFFYARPIIKVILALKDLEQQLKVLNFGLDPDGRMYSTFNAKVADTGRWTSSKSHYNRGTNMQNIAPRMRRIFIADPGTLIAHADLEQAESRGVAYLSGDPAYIEACESGDIHTFCARLIWPGLDWTGDLAKDRKVADQKFYRDFSYRDMTKRGGHASNYYGKPPTVAKHLKVETKVVEAFQEKYFSVFPGIPKWHLSILRQLQEFGYTESPLGRRRVHFGRLNDEATLRKAIASVPQGLICDILDIGMMRVWLRLEEQGAPVKMLLQGHDSVTSLIPDSDDFQIYGQAITRCLTVPISVLGRTMTIPVEMKYGYNWRDLVKPAMLRELPRPISNNAASWLSLPMRAAGA